MIRLELLGNINSWERYHPPILSRPFQEFSNHHPIDYTRSNSDFMPVFRDYEPRNPLMNATT
jgi:hypothetical protein